MKTEKLEEAEKKSKEIAVWIESLLQEKLPKPTLRENLLDGVVLCNLVNALAPGALKRFHKKPRMLAMKIENIGFFLATCKSRLNLPPTLLFQPTDIHDDSDNISSMRKVLNVLSFLKGEGEGEMLKDDDDDDDIDTPATVAEEDEPTCEPEPEPEPEQATPAVVHATPVAVQAQPTVQAKPATSTATEGKLDTGTNWYINGTKSDYVDFQDDVTAALLDTINVELTVETKRKLLRRLQNQITFVEEKIMSSSNDQLRDLAHGMGLGDSIEDIPKGKSRDWTVEFILKYGRAQ